MWTYLENWVVQDGALPELEPGMHLRAGLRANCSDVGYPTVSLDGVTDLADADAANHDFRYVLTGIAGAGTKVESFFHAPGMKPAPRPMGTEFPIRAGEHMFIAMAPLDAAPIRAGARVSVDCTFSIMPEYEFEDLELPDARADWLVRNLKVEARGVLHDSATGVGIPAEVTQLTDIDRMRKWDDDPDPALNVRYLLDLTP